jgi:hypothetical protein
MTAFLLALALLLSPAPIEGRCVYYAESWQWDRIAAVQGVTIPAGYIPIARPDCGQLGSTGTLYLGDLVVPFVAADCTAPEDQERLARLNIVGEVPYPVAVQAGFVAAGWAECRLEVEE